MRPTVFDIRCKTAEFYNVHPDVIEAASKRMDYVRPRHVAIWLTRQLTDLGFVDIGRRFGGRDCTTVHYACDKIDDLLQRDPHLRAEVRLLWRALGQTEPPAALSSEREDVA